MDSIKLKLSEYGVDQDCVEDIDKLCDSIPDFFEKIDTSYMLEKFAIDHLKYRVSNELNFYSMLCIVLFMIANNYVCHVLQINYGCFQIMPTLS